MAQRAVRNKRNPEKNLTAQKDEVKRKRQIVADRAPAALRSEEVADATLLTFPDVFPQHEETVDPRRFVSALLTICGHRIAFFWHRRLLSEEPCSAAFTRSSRKER
jgi:hypothetical protein